MSYQDIVQIGEVLVPVIIEEDEIWYPLRYIGEKVLLRGDGLRGKEIREKYDKDIKKLKINFDKINNGGIQQTNCISKKGLKELLDNTQVGRHTLEKRKAQNLLMNFLGLKPITERELIVDKLNQEYINEYDEYTKDVVAAFVENNPNTKFQLCTHCDKYYPLASKFFGIHSKASTGYNKICLICNKNMTRFAHDNKELSQAYKESGEELYKALKEDNIIQVYKKYLYGEMKHLSDCYNNKDDYLRIIRWLYDNGKLTKDNLSSDKLEKDCKLKYLHKYLTMHEIYTHLFDEDYYFYPWKYPNYKFREVKLTYEIANRVFDNYLQEFNVKEDPLSFDYEKLITDAKLGGISKFGSILDFAVQYNKFRYAGYMFKTRSVNYYKDDENIKFDLKYLIEQDMKIPIEKIPLYLTRNNLHKRCSPLHHAIITNRNKSIFEWVNELYPEKFIIQDFEINPYRNEFDSDTEAFIDDILRQIFKNVFYNQRNTDRTITLNNTIPDWFIFLDSGVWIIEYLGMYIPGNTDSRTLVYLNKTERKFEKQEKLRGYNILYLLPDDIKNNFEGVKEKIKIIQ